MRLNATLSYPKGAKVPTLFPLLALLWAVPAIAQDVTGSWVGPLFVQLGSVKGPMPTAVTLTQTGDQVSGTWKALPPNDAAGTMRGTLKDGRYRLTVTITVPGEAGKPCEAASVFEGHVSKSAMLELDGDKWKFPACAELKNLSWALQRD